MNRWVPVSLVAAAIAVPAALVLARVAEPSSATRPVPAVSAEASAAAAGRYADAVDAAHRHGLRVWLEADLVKRWQAGPGPFQAAVATLGTLAKRPGVAGIKIADELGYQDGLTTPGGVQDFLRASRTALATAAPGKPLLVDLLVPELGCLPDHTPPVSGATACAAQQRGRYPQLALTAVDGYLRSGDLDVLDLSTGLLGEATYASWGVDTDTAQRTAWQAVRARGWDGLVTVQARKAMAHPGRYAGGPARAEAALTTYLDIPAHAGATAVDVWTWRQKYEGQLYRLADPGPRDNPLWQGLLTRRATGYRLFTHFTPSSVESTVDGDLQMIATVFTDLFVAAGTG